MSNVRHPERAEVPSFLRQLAQRRLNREREEHCELCSKALWPDHPHLLNPKTREIVCACDGCAVLFCGQQGAHYLRVPRRIRVLADFQVSDAQWDALLLPINLAFFFEDRGLGRARAMYPSPAGATESLLALASWAEIAAEASPLATMEPDVEAFLVNRLSGTHEYYIVPIDECYRLVGLIRVHWKGLSGGAEAWKQIHGYFQSLRSRAVVVREPANA